MLSSGFVESDKIRIDKSKMPNSVCNMSYSFPIYGMDGDVVGYDRFSNVQEVIDERHCDIAFTGWVRTLHLKRSASLI